MNKQAKPIANYSRLAGVGTGLIANSRFTVGTGEGLAGGVVRLQGLTSSPDTHVRVACAARQRGQGQDEDGAALGLKGS